MHYSGQLLKQLYVLVLGLDVIGNPFGLVVGLTKGVEDLFYEPFQVQYHVTTFKNLFTLASSLLCYFLHYCFFVGCNPRPRGVCRGPHPRCS